MRKTDWPSLDARTYPKRDTLVTELTALVNFCQMNPASAAAVKAWFVGCVGELVEQGVIESP